MMKFITAAAAALLMAGHAEAACAAKEGGDAGEKTDTAGEQACVADAGCMSIVMSFEDSCKSSLAGAMCGTTDDAAPSSATCAADAGAVCVKLDPTGGDAHELCESSTCSFQAKSTAAAVATSCKANAKCKTLFTCICSGTVSDAEDQARCAALNAAPTPAPAAASNAAHAAPLLVLLLVGYFAWCGPPSLADASPLGQDALQQPPTFLLWVNI
jgi:hypothetical protein